MAKTQPKEFHSSDVKIDQKPDLGAGATRAPEIVHADTSLSQEDFNELAFMEEPVTIRLERSSDKNAPPSIYCAVNGRGAEILVDKRWVPITYLPVGQVLITKRKYLEVLARAKVDRVETVHDDATVEHPDNRVKRFTSQVQSFSVLNDSDRGHAWLTDMIRRNSL